MTADPLSPHRPVGLLARSQSAWLVSCVEARLACGGWGSIYLGSYSLMRGVHRDTDDTEEGVADQTYQ